VISAVVQDALISVKDLTFDRDAQRFVLVANRFRWEGTPANPNENGIDGAAIFERTWCAVSFANVKTISYRGFRRRDDERILSLLAIRSGEEAGTIELEFAGGAAVRLGVSAIKVHVTDIGEAWPTAWQPDHSVGDPP